MPKQKSAVKEKGLPLSESLINTISEDVPPVNALTVPAYTLQVTDNENLFRVVDRAGDWTHYYNRVTKHYLPAVNHIIKHGFPKGEGLQKFFQNHTPEVAKEILETAGERGSRVHDAFRQMIDGVEITIDRKFKNDLTGRYEELSIDEWKCLTAWVAWVAEYKPQVIVAESAVLNEKVGYAGTVDFIGTIEVKGNRVLVLLDWKTSSGIWDDYKLQTAAYAHALKKLPVYTGVVRVGTRHKSGYEMKLWDKNETREHYKKFLSAKDIFSMNHTEYQPSDEVIPAVLAVNIPRFIAKVIKTPEAVAAGVGKK